MIETCYTEGVLTDLETDHVYKLGGVKVIESSVSDMGRKKVTQRVIHITGGNGLIAIDRDGILNIEKVETNEGATEAVIPKTTVTLIACNIRDYKIEEE